VVALVSALTTMRFAIHGREVAVPNLVDKIPAEARRLTEEGGFELTVESRYYSSTVPAGKILSQAPAAGTLVRRGWEIRVAQSLGPQRIQIPAVVGQSERAAEMNIERRGLEVSAVAEMPWPTDSAHPAGSGQATSGQATGGQITNDEVLAQTPPPNATGVSSPKISLLVASQSPPQAFLMPTFVGQPLGNVTSRVQGAGLHVGTVIATPNPSDASSTQTSPSPASVITSQNPPAGEKILTGSTVNFTVR
jgi:eukaryotic-like serine/threonine-protein kinase